MHLTVSEVKVILTNKAKKNDNDGKYYYCTLLILLGSTLTSPTGFPMLFTVTHFPHRLKCWSVSPTDCFWGHFLLLFS